MNEFKNILVEQKKDHAQIVINRPPFNVLNIETMDEITKALKQIDGWQKIKCVTITGSGVKAFSAGVDVQDHSEEFVIKMLDSFHQMLNTIQKLSKPVVAIVNGVAFGGGLELVIGCDLAIAAETAQLGQPEIKLGVFPTYANAILPRVMTRKKAMEILLLGDNITATEAAQLGLINKAVPAEELGKSVEQYVARFSEKSAAALNWAKKSIYQAIDLDSHSSLKSTEEIYLNHLMKTDDAQEGVKAFLEKRQPVWRNS